MEGFTTLQLYYRTLNYSTPNSITATAQKYITVQCSIPTVHFTRLYFHFRSLSSGRGGAVGRKGYIKYLASDCTPTLGRVGKARKLVFSPIINSFFLIILTSLHCTVLHCG